MSKHGNWNLKIDVDADTGEIVRATLSVDLVPAKPTREDALLKIATAALYLADNPGLMKDPPPMSEAGMSEDAERLSVEEIRRKLIARLQEIVNDLSGDRDYMGGMDRGLQEALNIVEGRDYWDDGD
ncbi:RDF protein [Mycobacterium phage PhrostyMug]|nr:RDF protein [Mycobacterium phage PhrostyMug]AGU92282.1 hypothetical protein PHROSTYMUG_79 [Mycobacterium phage PhrostyMug]AGU92381.1 RDF protein [Mycobacterium phage SargentShorty9]